MPSDFIAQLQAECGTVAAIVGGSLSRAVCRRWLHTFCPNVKSRTGRWVYQGYWWHAYSFEHEAP